MVQTKKHKHMGLFSFLNKNSKHSDGNESGVSHTNTQRNSRYNIKYYYRPEELKDRLEKAMKQFVREHRIDVTEKSIDNNNLYHNILDTVSKIPREKVIDFFFEDDGVSMITLPCKETRFKRNGAEFVVQTIDFKRDGKTSIKFLANTHPKQIVY